MSTKQAKKRPRGRPPKPASEKKDLKFQIGLDQRRKQRYRKSAKKIGVDLSEWIRRVCDVAADELLC